MAARTRSESDSRRRFLNRELSWLGFARRVLAQVEIEDLPLLERIKFAGIVGMLHDEFFMKRMSGLKRQIASGSRKSSIDGRTPFEEFEACRTELLGQLDQLERIMGGVIRPALAGHGMAILDHAELSAKQRKAVREYFEHSVLPILTPLAVDAEHPFPFISNLGLNLAVLLPHKTDRTRFVRIKVPNNRPRWVRVPGGGFVPLEQAITANLDLMFPGDSPKQVCSFRITRGADGNVDRSADLSVEEAAAVPGSIVHQVSGELKARRFAGIVRLEVAGDTPKKLVRWLADQMQIPKEDVYRTGSLLGLKDLMQFEIEGHDELRYAHHAGATHPRFADLDPRDPGAIFEEIARGDVLLHHPYHSFDSSVLRFLQSAAVDPATLAIKLTIYRTSSDSPTVQALAEAARSGKQVAVLVEITARFDEAPNIAWGRYLENEGAHVSYGVERLKTHVKLALVVREEAGEIRRYVHVGTGNYHSGTARIYEDLGILTCDPEICEDVSGVFNSLTGAGANESYRKLIVAPKFMRQRFVELIRREAKSARAGKVSGIQAKMNQLQDPDMIRELYRASRAGVPITLNVRGLCCLRPGVKKLSENIRVFGIVGRFLEHSRIFRFTNGGDPVYYIGSADWMKRNLDRRMETMVPILDERAKRELDEILAVYEDENSSAWDCDPDGGYTRRQPAENEPRRAAQQMFIDGTRASEPPAPTLVPTSPESSTGSS